MRKVLIVGASVRAAAQSARRAGLAPIGFDLFADRDLTKIASARTVSIADYPAAIETLAAELVAEDVPWMYAGAWENHADRVQPDRPNSTTLGQFRPLASSRARSNRLDAGPLRPRDCLRGRSPRTRRTAVRRLLARQALRLRRRSRDRPFDRVFSTRSALFLSTTTRRREPFRPFLGRRRRLGTDRRHQATGGSSQTAPFAYRGSVGPWPIEFQERQSLETIGRILAEDFGLRGLIGLDFISAAEGPIPIEINPRYTASTEVLELAMFRPILAEHRRVFEPNAAANDQSAFKKTRFVGKSIVFAEADGRFPEDVGDGAALEEIDAFEVPPLADIPEAGSTFVRGRPVVTVLVESLDLDECQALLRASVRSWRERLRRASFA